MEERRTPASQGDLERVERAHSALGYRFSDLELLRRALTHPSLVSSAGTGSAYERLEFLGDALLDAIVAEEIFIRFPEMREGEMTKLKATAVSGSSLERAARELGLEDAVLFGQSELRALRRGLASALEDVFEALVAAIYLDGGHHAARGFVLRTLGDRIQPDAVAAREEHPKSALQELLQASGRAVEYELRESAGPPHDPTFTVAVLVDGAVMGLGTGHSKKEAEGLAAAQALASLAEGSAG